MADSEPWRTLGRDYETSLRIVSDLVKEVYVAYVGDETEAVAGFLILNTTGAFVGYIQTICVAPEFRDRGIGTKLIEFAERRIFPEFPNVFICVSSFNYQARKLYEQLGYKMVGALMDYIVRGHSELLLRKTIGPFAEFRRGAPDRTVPVAAGRAIPGETPR